MTYSPTGRMIKYPFCCKGVKEAVKFDSPSVERLYKKLYKAKQILENAKPTIAYERKFILAMDRLDELLCDIERLEVPSEREIALEAFLIAEYSSNTDKEN